MSSKLKKCSSCGKFIQENKLTLINNKFVCNACKSNNIKLEKKTPEIKVRNKPVIVKDMVALNKSVQKNNKSPNNNKCTHVVENDKPEIVCHK